MSTSRGLVKRATIAALASVVLLSAACGKNQAPPVLPPPGAGNVGGGYYGAGYGGSCTGGAAGGQFPLNQGGAPFVSTLTDFYGNGLGDSMQLMLSYMTPPNAANNAENVVGGGSISLPSLSAQLPGFQFTSLCMSTQDPTNGSSSPGKFVSIDKSVAVTMRGLIANPYYQAGVGFGRVPTLYVAVGYSGGAFIYPGNMLEGYVDVTIEYWDPFGMIPTIIEKNYYAQ